MNGNMGMGTKCEDLCVTCKCAAESIHLRRGTKQVDKMQQLAFATSHPRIGMVGIFMKWPGDQHTLDL